VFTLLIEFVFQKNRGLFENFYGDFQGPSKASSLVSSMQHNLPAQPNSVTIALESDKNLY